MLTGHFRRLVESLDHAARVSNVLTCNIKGGAVVHDNDLIAAIHTPNGENARQRASQGFTFITVASDLTHLEQAARDHLAKARGN